MHFHYVAGSHQKAETDEGICWCFGQKEDEETGFDMKNLAVCTMDLFGAGTETTTTTIHWGLLYMIYYPDIQGEHWSAIATSITGS